MSDSSNVDADSATIFVCSSEHSDITESSVDDVVILSNLITNVTYVVRCKACNDVRNSTMSAASDPIVASTLANPPYITEVVMSEDVELTVFLDATWNGRSVVTGYVCTGASVWVFTGEVLVISDLVAGHAYWFQCAARSAASFSPFSTTSQMVTAKAPTLPPVFHCISPQDQTVVMEVASIPANSSFASTTSIVHGASI